MPAYDESKHARDAKGKFASTSTGTTTLEHPVDPAFDDLDAEVLTGIARGAAAWMAKSDRLDADELAADTVVTVLQSISRKNGEMPDDLKNYVRTTMRHLASARIYGSRESTDQAAMKEYIKQRDALVEQRGQSLSSVEEDVLAKQIRDAMPAGRRAKEGYHRLGRMDSPFSDLNADRGDSDDVDMSFEASEQLHTLMSEQSRSYNPQYETGSRGESASALAEAGRVREAKLAVWDTIAETDGLAMTSANEARPAERKAALAYVDAHGAERIAARIVDGESSTEDFEHFSQPWGNASRKDVVKIAEAMDRRGPYAGDIWKAAHESSIAKARGGSDVSMPMPKPKASLRAESAGAARQFVGMKGGAAAMSRQFLSGELDQRESDVLFAPWGGAAAAGRDATHVAERLSLDVDADATWGKSLDEATR